MIDPSLIKFLPETAQEELRHWETLFSSQGWTQLQAILEESYTATKNTAIDATTWEDNRVAVGNLQALKSVFNMPILIENQYTAMAQDVQDAKTQEAEDREFEYE